MALALSHPLRDQWAQIVSSRQAGTLAPLATQNKRPHLACGSEGAKLGLQGRFGCWWTVLVEGDMDSGAALTSGPTAPFQPSQPPFLTCKWDLFLCVCLEGQYNEELIGPTADSDSGVKSLSCPFVHGLCVPEPVTESLFTSFLSSVKRDKDGGFWELIGVPDTWRRPSRCWLLLSEP